MDESAAPDDLVTVSECARLLGVNKSTISRQLGRVFPNRGTAEKPLVSVSEARAARAATLNPLKARNKGAVLGYEDALPVADEDPAPAQLPLAAPAAAPSPRTAQLTTAHTAEKAIKAQLLQLQLADKLGATCDREGVEEGARYLAEQLQEMLTRRNRSLAEAIAELSDPNEIEIALEEADTALLERLRELIEAQVATRTDAAAA